MPPRADNATLVRSYFEAWPRQDRALMERAIAADFHFTSPLDNRIDRKTYFERCWPNSQNMESFEFHRVVMHGDEVLVTYELRLKDGRRMRNSECLTLNDGQIVDVEVYFGWNIPHDAPEGAFVDKRD